MKIFLRLFDVLNIVYTNGHVACRQLHVNNALNIDFEYEIHRFIGLNYGLWIVFNTILRVSMSAATISQIIKYDYKKTKIESIFHNKDFEIQFIALSEAFSSMKNVFSFFPNNGFPKYFLH